MNNSRYFERRLANCDTSLFAPIKASLTEDDKKSLMAIQYEIRSKKNSYSYLEIGSYLGGSLQTFLLDAHCHCVYSIDSRVSRQVDERGEIDFYPNNTSLTMLKNIQQYYSQYMNKLIAFNHETGEVNPRDIKHKPDICFIDGNHTDDAVFNDFLFCLSVGSPHMLILFHDVQMIFRGIRKSIKYLRGKNIPFQSFMLPSSLGIVALRNALGSPHRALDGRLAVSMDGVFYCLESLSVFRDYYKVTNNSVFISAFMRILRLIRVSSVTR